MTEPRRSMAGGVERILVELTTGADEARASERAALEATQGGEYTQQVQARVSGILGKGILWREATVGFVYPFLFDPTRRDNPLENPHFSSGVEIVKGGPALVQAQVRSWVTNEQGWVTGAALMIGAYAPGAPKKTRFEVVIHLSFSGYAASAEEAESG